MRDHSRAGPALFACLATVIMLLAMAAATPRLPYLERLTAVSALIALIAQGLRRRWSRARPPRSTPPLDPYLVGLSLLEGAGLWLLLSRIELSGYFGYPIVPVPEAHPLSAWRAVWLLAAMALLVPLAAETYFRGLVLEACEPFGRRTALALSSLAYAAYGLTMVRLFGPVPLVLLGLALAYIASRSRSLLASSLVHAGVNVPTVAVFVLNDWRPGWAAQLPLTSGWWALAGALTAGAGLWLMQRATGPSPAATEPHVAWPRSTRLARAGVLAALAATVMWTGTWPPPPALPMPQLTAEQKEAEFHYLTRLIRDIYAPADSLTIVTGLAGPLSSEADYIRRAAATQDNWEYYEVFREYLVQLSHGGHAYLISPESARNYRTWYVSYDYGLYPALLPRARYWSEMETLLDTTWYAHSDLNLVYQDGSYWLAEPATVDGREVPAGTRIAGAEGLSTDAYVLQQQSRERLRYDAVSDKPSLHWAYDRLLLVDPGPDHAGWQVDFELPDGSRFRGTVPKRPGHNWERYHVTRPNVIAVELNDQVGYLRVHSFQFEPHDDARIQAFMQASGGRYGKLIIDVRGNGGGDPRYWMDSLVAPLLAQPLRYDVLTALRRPLFDRLHIRYWLQRLGGLGMFGPAEHFGGITEIAPPAGYDPQQWQAFKITSLIAPAAAFPFDGQVYVLADDLCASACENFVLAIKTTGLARLVGTQTWGCAAGVFPPLPITLPESGITFMLEAGLVFNPDGTVNQIYGTTPDVRLSPARPPASYSRGAVLADPWVQWVLQDPLRPPSSLR